MNLPNMLVSSTTGQLAVVADFLATFADRTDLAPLFSVEIAWNRDADTFDVRAHLGMACVEDLEEIDAIRSWALALGGHVLLGEVIHSPYLGSHRTLSALVAMPNGGLLDVWTFVDRTPLPALSTR
jgi:hypothetical protein